MKDEKRGKDRRNEDKRSENRGRGRKEDASSEEEGSDDEFLPQEDDEVRQSHNSLTIEKLPADLFFVKIKKKNSRFQVALL